MLFKVESTNYLDNKTKKSLRTKIKNVVEGVQKVEEASGIRYPLAYVEPVLNVVESVGNTGGLGVLYARTIPVEHDGMVSIVVELSAPLVLYATKATIKIVLAHELLHYVDLVRKFTRMDIISDSTSTSIFEEQYADSSRAIQPSKVFKDKKFVTALNKKTSVGLVDEKLNGKCKEKWIDKGLPIAKISLGRNQLNVSVQSILRSNFDPDVKELVQKIT